MSAFSCTKSSQPSKLFIRHSPSTNEQLSTMLITAYVSTFLLASTLGSETATSGQKSMLNKHLKISAEPWRPFFVFYCNGREINWTDKCPDKGTETYGGVLWDLLKFIQHARNITFSISRTSDGNWGVCHEKNNCTGMIGVVNRREADLALGIFV